MRSICERVCGRWMTKKTGLILLHDFKYRTSLMLRPSIFYVAPPSRDYTSFVTINYARSRWANISGDIAKTSKLLRIEIFQVECYDDALRPSVCSVGDLNFSSESIDWPSKLDIYSLDSPLKAFWLTTKLLKSGLTALALTKSLFRCYSMLTSSEDRYNRRLKWKKSNFYFIIVFWNCSRLEDKNNFRLGYFHVVAILLLYTVENKYTKSQF